MILYLISFIGLLLVIIGGLAFIKGELKILNINSRKKAKLILIFGLLLLPSFYYADQALEVHFSENIIRDNENIIIRGETSLQDGTILTYQISNQLQEQQSPVQGEIEVSEGEFADQINISPIINGELTVTLKFNPAHQPENLKEEYGPEGRNLAGDVELFEPETAEETAYFGIKIIQSFP